MQNKGFGYICFKCHGFLFFSHMAARRPFWHWKAMNFTITWVREKISLLFACEMTWSVPWPHYALPECGRNREMGWRSRIIQSKTLLLQHWQTSEARPCMSRTPLFLTPLSLSRGQSFIHAMFFCHYHDPISFENRVSQIAERAGAGTRAFKRNCPLEFNCACCWVLLQKVLC